jgi:hypothetical protein
MRIDKYFACESLNPRRLPEGHLIGHHKMCIITWYPFRQINLLAVAPQSMQSRLSFPCSRICSNQSSPQSEIRNLGVVHGS